MKKVLQIISAAVVSVACIGSFASAQQSPCDGVITVTGPDSNNQVICNEVNDITLTCSTTAPIDTTNSQTGQSGQGVVVGNNAAGEAVTGGTYNVNGTDVTLGVTGCLAAAVTNGGGGGGAAAPEEAPGGVGEVSELPNTSSTPVAAIAAIGALALVAITGIARLAVSAYQRLSAK